MKYIFALIFPFFLMAGTLFAKDPDGFVKITKNPKFQFAQSIAATSTDAGENSPINEDYFFAKYPVTNAEYAKFLKENPAHQAPRYWKSKTFPRGKENHPVLWVSLDDAEAYCAWLSKKNQLWQFRLPTESEWENAARGNAKNQYPWGDANESKFTTNKELNSKFNYNAVVAAHFLKENPTRIVKYVNKNSPNTKQPYNTLISITPNGGVSGWVNHKDWTGFIYTDLFKEISDAGGWTSPVDAFPRGATKSGIFDLSGNSWDWTSSKIVARNGAERGKTVNAIRGGSWYATARSCSILFRGEGRDGNRAFNTVGFRLVAVPKKK